MTEAPAVPFLGGAATRAPDSNGDRPGPPARLEVEVHDPVAPAAVLAVREARRARNRERGGLMARLRCECGRASCRATFPAGAEVHRGVGERFIVVPAHAADGFVVRVADLFFVVELNGRATRFPRLPEPTLSSDASVRSERARNGKRSPSDGGELIEIVAHDRYCAALLLEHAAPLFPAELAPGSGWIVRLQPPQGGGWVPALLSLVERWLAAAPLPCAKVSYSERSYLIRATREIRPRSPQPRRSRRFQQSSPS